MGCCWKYCLSAAPVSGAACAQSPNKSQINKSINLVNYFESAPTPPAAALKWTYCWYDGICVHHTHDTRHTPFMIYESFFLFTIYTYHVFCVMCVCTHILHIHIHNYDLKLELLICCSCKSAILQFVLCK